MPDTKAVVERLMNEPIHKWIASLLVTACFGLVAVVGNNLIDGQRETNRSLAEIREALPVMKFQITQQERQIQELKDMLRQQGYRMPWNDQERRPQHGWIYRQPGILPNDEAA